MDRETETEIGRPPSDLGRTVSASLRMLLAVYGSLLGLLPILLTVDWVNSGQCCSMHTLFTDMIEGFLTAFSMSSPLIAAFGLFYFPFRTFRVVFREREV